MKPLLCEECQYAGNKRPFGMGCLDCVRLRAEARRRAADMVSLPPLAEREPTELIGLPPAKAKVA